MAVEITIPQIGKAKKTAKDLVISSLMYEHPLTLAKLTNSIKKHFRADVTFQGIRKAVNQLIEEEILEKKNKEYSINKKWVLELRSFIEKLQETAFTENTGIKDIQSIGEDIKVYTFDNLIDLDKFWNKIIEKWFDEDSKNNKKKYYVQQSGHTWYVLGQLEEETEILEKIKNYKIKFYTFVTANTPLDNWAKKYYEEQEFHYITSNKSSSNSRYFAVYNDYIIQTEYPENLTKEIDQVYNKAKNFESFQVAKLISILRKKSELKLTVMRNPVVAEQLRKNILSNFN